jgi:diguanylate cyclase (GGDEF)-like protein
VIPEPSIDAALSPVVLPAEAMVAVEEPAALRLAPGPSFLCEDETTRRRMVDMERHMRPARMAVFGLLAVVITAVAPWVGWWPLAPLAGATAGFVLVERLVARASHPEYLFMAAWSFSQLMIGLSIVLSGGPESVFLPWLAIPAATLAARFNRRGVIAGVAWTALIMVAATMGVNAQAVLNAPQKLLVPLTLLGGVVILTVGLMRSDLKHRAQAAIDPLTGLFNREALARRAAELFVQARVAGTAVDVLIGDLDHFKAVNDRHGHLVGDAVLREVANALRTTLRAFDHIYRYGGEEFVILLPGGGAAGAIATAERLRLAIAEANPCGIPITMSFGVAPCGETPSTFEELLGAADGALYRAKADGRDRVCSAIQEADR